MSRFHNTARPFVHRYRRSGAALALTLTVVLAAGCGETSSNKSDTTPTEAGRTVVVPAVEGEPARKARGAVREAGLKAFLRRRYDDATSKGEVIKQKPAGGEEVKRGARVTLVVSRGAKPAPEPEPPEAPPEQPTETQEAPGGDCDPSYPDACIPSPPPELNCPDVDQQGFAVKGDDPHGFDADGDGVGCE